MDVLEQVQRKGAGTVEKLAVLRLKVQKFAAFDPGKQRLQPFDRGGGQHAFVAQRIANLARMSLQFRGGVSKQRGQRPQREFHLGASHVGTSRSEEHTSELQSLMRISYAVFCLKKKRQP